jgi:hypothetical protein
LATALVSASAASAKRPVKAFVAPVESAVEPKVDIVVGGKLAPQMRLAGKSYVEAREAEEYSVTITNPWSVRLAVAVAVDGLNSIDAQHTTAAAAKKWIIPPHGKITVRGWQVSPDRLRQFVFTTEKQSYGAKLGKTRDLGNISVVAYKERGKPEVALAAPSYSAAKNAAGVRTDTPAQAQPSTPGKGAGATAKMGAAAKGMILDMRQSDKAKAPTSADDLAATGQGRSVDNHVKFIDLQLEPEPVFEASIRYEFREALVRLGVLPSAGDQPTADLQHRDDASGFMPVTFAPEK